MGTYVRVFLSRHAAWWCPLSRNRTASTPGDNAGGTDQFRMRQRLRRGQTLVLVQYTVGTLLGAMSARLFPATFEEQQRWEADRRYWMQRIEQQERKMERISRDVLQHV